MFKVYTMYSNNEKFYTDNFFVKFGSAIVWIKSDITLNEKPYFSDKKMQEILGNSNEKERFDTLQKGESMQVQYGSCTNNYLVVKMSEQEVKMIKEIEKKRKTFAKITTPNNQQIKEFEANIAKVSKTLDNAIKFVESLN